MHEGSGVLAHTKEAGVRHLHRELRRAPRADAVWTTTIVPSFVGTGGPIHDVFVSVLSVLFICVL